MVVKRYCKNCDKEVIFDELTGKWVHSNNGFPQCYFDVADPKTLKCDKSIVFVNPYNCDKRFTVSCKKEWGHIGPRELVKSGEVIIWRTD